MTVSGLLDAVAVLADQASGRVPDRARVLAGALALDTLCHEGIADRDIRDAVEGLHILATGRGLELDANGRARAARLAEAVRKLADRLTANRDPGKTSRQDPDGRAHEDPRSRRAR